LKTDYPLQWLNEYYYVIQYSVVPHFVAGQSFPAPPPVVPDPKVASEKRKDAKTETATVKSIQKNPMSLLGCTVC
jgi:hypothetical protein